MAIKTHRGGKFPVLDTGGYYGRNEAGIPQDFTSNTAGVKREFIGSGTEEYNFYSDTKGILTVRADSYEDAWRIAKARGYKRRRPKSWI